MTTKQRAYLRSLAMTMDPIFQIGKSSLTPEFTTAISEALEARELIKITLLNNSDEDLKEIAVEIANKLGAELVCTIGHKIVLYRYSKKKGVVHIKY